MPFVDDRQAVAGPSKVVDNGMSRRIRTHQDGDREAAADGGYLFQQGCTKGKTIRFIRFIATGSHWGLQQGQNA